MNTTSRKLYLWFVFVCLLAVSLHSQEAASKIDIVVRGQLGAQDASLPDATAEELGELGTGPIIGFGLGLGDREGWTVGLLGESVARESSSYETAFTVRALSVWAERHVCFEYPWSMRLSLSLGATNLQRQGGQVYNPPWTDSFSQYGAMIQPGLALGWSPTRSLMISGTLAYRWTSIESIEDGDGDVLTIDGKPMDIDLNGIAVFLVITLFLR